MRTRKRIILSIAAAATLATGFALTRGGESPPSHEAATGAEDKVVVATAAPRFDYQRIKTMLDERPPMTLDEVHGRVREVVGERAAPVLAELAEQERVWDDISERQTKVHAELGAAIRASTDRDNDPAIKRLDEANNQLLDELAETTERISALTAEVTAMYEEAMYAQLGH